MRRLFFCMVLLVSSHGFAEEGPPPHCQHSLKQLHSDIAGVWAQLNALRLALQKTHMTALDIYPALEKTISEVEEQIAEVYRLRNRLEKEYSSETKDKLNIHLNWILSQPEYFQTWLEGVKDEALKNDDFSTFMVIENIQEASRNFLNRRLTRNPF